MYYILEYDYVDDILARRDPFRAQHITQATELAEAGKIVLAGATGDPVAGAMFIFKDTEETEIRQFIATDPYVLNDLVTDWRIIPWTVVVGN